MKLKCVCYIITIVLFLGLCNDCLFAIDTVGCLLRPYGFYSPNLVKVRWNADILEYEINQPFRIRIEFNSVRFTGSQGVMSVGAMIQNVSHIFTDDSCHISSRPPGVGLYFSSFHKDLQDGVEFTADPDEFPKFGRIFENIDGLGHIGNNIYTREPIGNPSPSNVIQIQWIVTKGNTVIDPSMNLTKNMSCEWESLTGTFVEWIFEVVINGAKYEPAHYYLPITHAEYIDPRAPVILHQEYFGACDEKLNEHKGTVKYYDLKASDGASWFYMDRWRLMWAIDDQCGNTDLRYGWYQDGKYLVSRVGHEDDIEKCKRAVGELFYLPGPHDVSIVISEPNGGEMIKGGGVKNITWETTGDGIDHVHLEYSTDSGASYEDIDVNTPDDGLYQWTIPEKDSSAVRIKAIAEDASNAELAHDESDADFIIDTTPPETIAALDGAKGENGWYKSNVEVTLSATDNLSGVEQTKYRINEGAWEIYSSPFTVTGTAVHYYSEDRVGNIEAEKENEIKIDKTKPSTPQIVDDGDYTSSITQLHAQLIASNDGESGIVGYQCAIGMQADGSDLDHWTDVGMDTEVTLTDLALTDGEIYYIGVKAKNGAGLSSEIGITDGITVKVELNIHLHSGWNLISICLDTASNNLFTFLAPVEGPCKSVWSYDSNPGWKRYIYDGDNPDNNLLTIVPGSGYYIEMTGEATLPISGDWIADADIPLFTGWNLVGWSSETEKHRVSALQSIMAVLDCIYAYDSESRKWSKYVVNGPETLNDLTILKPGKGYWIKVKADCVWK